MKHSLILALLFLLIPLIAAPSLRAQVTALSCSALDVQSAINSATTGQTVNVPAGTAPTCSWGLNAVTLNKAITLNGAGQGTTVITLTANPSFTVTKQTTAPTRIQNLSFTGTSANAFPHFISVGGPWPTGQPVIFQNVTFNAFGGTIVGVGTPGGVIFSHVAFVGTWDNALFVVKNVNGPSWNVADTIGNRDTTGFNNVYLEDSTFIGGSNGVTDCDDGCRMVVRHNTFGFNGQDSGGPNSHGDDSSPQGMRHFEIYNNSFNFPDKTCPNGNSSLSNVNQFIWLRGGTGIVANNSFASLFSSCWNDKAEIKISNRGAEDDRPQGTCAQVTYPVTHQIGQNFNGTALFTDPVWFWGNTSTDGPDPGNPNKIDLSAGWVAFVGSIANPCFSVYQTLGYGNTDAEQWSHFFQFPRDAVNTTLGTNLCTNSSKGCNVDMTGGTPKPGYTAYPYPHPLVAGQSVIPPSTPTNLAATTSGGMVSLTWTASTGSPSPTGYTLYRGTVHGGPYVIAKSGLTSTSTTDTPSPTGAYFYVLTAFAGGIISGISGNGTVATITCVSVCTFPSGTPVTIGGDSQSGFNGTFSSTGQPTSNTFTIASSTVASGTGGGAWTSSGESGQSNEVTVNTSATRTVTLLPSSRTFASQTVGTSSGTQSVTFTNTSAAGNTVTISSKGITTGANPSDFTQTNNCPSLVMSGLTCTFNVTFTPTAPGSRSANLTVVDDATGSPQTVTLSGTGVAATPIVTLSPTSLDFGSQFVSTTSTARSIVLQNTGTGTLTISSIVATGDFADTTVPSSTCGGSLAPLASCSINVTFTPTLSGGRTGAITITDNAAGSPHVAGLTGTGTVVKCQSTGPVTISGVAIVCGP